MTAPSEDGLVPTPAVAPELDRWAAAFDDAVLASPDIDRFCSSSAWILPAHAAFHANHPARIEPLDGGFMALALGETAGLGRFLAPLEAMWGLACPMVGADARHLAREASRRLLGRSDWDVLWLGGLVRDAALFSGLVSHLGPHLELRLGPRTVRYQASLEGGFEGWLGRRSPRFRKMIRQLLRRTEGLTFEWIDGAVPFADPGVAEALYARIHAVETRSWKGREGTGFVAGDMRRFYELMVPRLAHRPRRGGAAGEHGLRVLFARDGDRDVAVCFGGVFGDTFRGLQNSFDDAFRELSLGNLMQAQTIARLASEGIATYDLGSEMEYKARWAEHEMTTVTLIGIRRA